MNSTAGGVDKGTPGEVPYSTRGRRETCLDDVSPADGVTPQRRLERIAARGPTASQRRSDVFLPRTYPRSKHTPASSLTLLPRVTRDPTHRPLVLLDGSRGDMMRVHDDWRINTLRALDCGDHHVVDPPHLSLNLPHTLITMRWRRHPSLGATFNHRLDGHGR